MDKINITRWIDAFQDGMFDAHPNPKEDVRTQIQAGWFDWFCKDSSLAAKTKKMGNIIKKVKAGGKVDLQNWYVWFKNNCPLNGPLYDDFRFAKLEDGTVMFTIQIDCCWNKSKYAVYGRTPDGEFQCDKPLFETDSVKDLVKWLNTGW